jgi:hypothetical protein
MTNTIQHSIKLGDAILVIGGESWSDFCSNYIQAYGQDALDRLVDAFTIAVGGTDVMAQAVQNVQAGGLMGVNPGLNPQTSAPQQWQPQARQQDPSPAVMCSHGPMVYRSGNKGGKAWGGHFCPAPKGSPDQCPPVWG